MPRIKSLAAHSAGSALPANQLNNNEPSARRQTRQRSGAKHEDRLTAILKVAANCFSEFGYEATSLDMIAERMGIHKATLYHYIEGKEWILLQCLLRSFGDLEKVMEHIQDRSTSPLVRLKYFAKHLAQAQNNEFGRCFAMVGSQPLDMATSGEIRKFQKRLDTAVRNLLTEGIKDGSLRDCDPALTSAMLFGAYNWVPRWHNPRSRLTLDQISDAFMDILERGIIKTRD